MEGEQNWKKNNQISRSKALGIITLLAALLIFQIVTFTIAKITQSKDNSLPEQQVDDPKLKELLLFSFDPNTITVDSLNMLGFSSKQAESIIKYRNKGGKFREKSDFAKMYVVSKEKYFQLEPYIVIKSENYYYDLEQSVGSRYINRNNKKSYPHNNYKNEKKQRLKCDINLSDSAQFTNLYGVGAFYAKKIVEYRKSLGGFFIQKEQLLEIYGIDSARFYGFYDQLTLDSAIIEKFTLSDVSLRFMEYHPYIGRWRAKKIVKYIQENGKEKCSLENLVSLGIFSKEQAAKLSPYVR